MAKAVYYVASSVDGYIAAPDGGVDWLAPFQSPAEDYGYAAFLATVGGLIMGRRTYDQVLGFGPWPYPGKPCRVVTSRPLPDAPPDVLPAAGPTEAAAALSGRIWLVGGSQLFEAYRAAGLIEEYIVTVVPVLLGAGVPLFRPGPGGRLRLLACHSFPGGVVQLRYAVSDGDPGAAEETSEVKPHHP
ncbi:MAG: dihydrofolate reductase family protein [Gemmataceae bacterium]